MAQAASASATLLAGPEAQEVCARLMGAVGPILASPVEPGTAGGLNGHQDETGRPGEAKSEAIGPAAKFAANTELLVFER